MKRISICIAAFAALCLPAAAADLPIKARPSIISNSYPLTSGMYFGVFAAGASTKVEATGLPGVNTAGLNTFGGSVGGTLGYVWGSQDGNRFLRVNVDAGWQNINGTQSGFAFGGPFSAQAAIQAGVPFAQIASFIPNLGLPSFPGLPVAPAGTTYGPPHMYAGIMADVEDVSFVFGEAKNTTWKVAPGLQIGMLVPTSNGLMIDARFEYVWNDSGTCIGGGIVCGTEGNTMRFKTGVQW